MSIKVLPYTPQWKLQFEALQNCLLQILQELVLDIVHVGSTSVPGLWAKPVIDIDIIIEDDKQILKNIIDKLADLGYRHRGNMGITGREAFKRVNDQAPFCPNQENWAVHHLYVCTQGSIGLNNHLALKRHLLAHPEKVASYSALKQKLAAEFPHDIDAYVDGKTDFIVDILKKEGLDASNTDLIDEQNRKDNFQ